MAQPLDAAQMDFIADLVQASILKKITTLDPALKNGFVFVMCGDCERFPEAYRYKKNLIKNCGAELKPHLLCLNGGPLLLPETSPLSLDGESRILKNQIRTSLELKDLNAVLLMLHAPCGAAGLAGLSIEATFSLFLQAAQELRQLHPEATLVTQCHLHKPNDELRTYQIDLDLLARANFKRAANA